MALTPDALKRALEDEAYARHWTNRLIKELNETGHSWSELAEASGLTVSALRWRAGEMRGRRPVAEQQADEPERPTAEQPTPSQPVPPDPKPTLAPPVALTGFMRGEDRWRNLDASGAQALLDELDARRLAFKTPGAPRTGTILTTVAGSEDQLRAHGFFKRGWVIVEEVVYLGQETARQLTERLTLDGHTPTVERRGKDAVVRWHAKPASS